MNDRPTADELLAAVRDYLLTEVAPAAPSHRDRFRALVAANVLAIVRRELAAKPTGARELAAIADLLGDGPAREGEPGPGPGGEPRSGSDGEAAMLPVANARLAAYIRAGGADDDPAARAVRDLVRGQVKRKLAVNNPAYLDRFATPVRHPDPL